MVARGMPRITQFCNSAGKTEAEAWVMWGCEKDYGKFVEGENNWKKLFLEVNYLNGMQGF